jgi:methylisocitrate lyase
MRRQIRRHRRSELARIFATILRGDGGTDAESQSRVTVVRVFSKPFTMASPTSAGRRFRDAMTADRPLQVLGTVSAYMARLADNAGAKALYVSGGGVAAFSCGVPDLGITTLDDVLVDVRRITDVTALPVLVDIDTGWGGAFNIARTIRSMARAGAAAVHIEDQVQAKRCGHRPGKAIVPTAEMVDRIKSAVDARTDADFVVVARTDAIASEGMAAAIERAQAYVEAGADVVFPEAVTTVAEYTTIATAVRVPILANVTEFGKTPLLTVSELSDAGVAVVLYPLSAFRAMSKAALTVYETILRDGTQRDVIPLMQTRDELYAHLGYYEYEAKLDALLNQPPPASPVKAGDR